MPPGTSALPERSGNTLCVHSACEHDCETDPVTSKDFNMSNKNTAKGVGNQVAGNAKEVAGKVSGNRKLEAEGRLQELKGDAQRVAGKVESETKKAIDKNRKG